MKLFSRIMDAVFNKQYRLNEQERENALKVFNEIKATLYDVDESEINKYLMTGKELILQFAAQKQHLAKAKIEWLLKTVAREHELVQHHKTRKCINREALADILDAHPTRVLKICEISDYERVIPAKAVKEINKVSDVFDYIFILYTDHSRGTARKVEKARDPIAFGMFMGNVTVPVENEGGLGILQTETSVMSDRLYYITDWEDDMCDLTLDRLVQEASQMNTPIEISSPREFVPLTTRMQNINEDRNSSRDSNGSRNNNV